MMNNEFRMNMATFLRSALYGATRPWRSAGRGVHSLLSNVAKFMRLAQYWECV